MGSKRGKVLLLITICLTVTVGPWFSQSVLKSESRDAHSPLTIRHTLFLDDREQEEQTDLASLLEKLSDTNEDVREGSRKRIVELGRRSKGNRANCYCGVIETSGGA